MRNPMIFFLFVGSTAATGCSGAASPDTSSADDAVTAAKSNWRPLMDTCVQSAVGGAAAQAFQDNNLQHLEGLTVDGDLAVEGTLTITVTTGNDEDGDTTRKVEVAQSVDTTHGTVSCKVIKIDGKAAGDTSSSKNALGAIVDTCTGTAIVAANKLSDNYWHLYGLKLDGDPAVDGTLKYTVTDGNDEDGNTDYFIDVKQSINRTTGKSTCTVTHTRSSR